uniref:Uncharacterized protein n=1 Tax=Haptolina ericina TaxID=156174 RepID=A0A7S3EQC5_9EUKA|mmetsp:Transcript_12870/g.29348  ORF Transcript_12870/g.29348 Transcript_12870/m.29348 type:complete len:246 (+) Transcript_12870:317-1054(+)
MQLRQPLWIQLTAPQKKQMETMARARHLVLASQAEKKQQQGRPPLVLPTPAHEYFLSGRKMYEYHVDTAENFMDWRMEQRFGGRFSQRWAQRPQDESALSAPPPQSELLQAGVGLAEVTAVVDAEVDVENAADSMGAGVMAAVDAMGAGTTGGVTADGAAAANRADAQQPCRLKQAEAKKLSPEELRSELARAGLAVPETGSGQRGRVLKADLLKALLPQCCDARLEAGADAVQPEREWDVKKVS